VVLCGYLLNDLIAILLWTHNAHADISESIDLGPADSVGVCYEVTQCGDLLSRAAARIKLNFR
jgi:hypothetical protein